MGTLSFYNSSSFLISFKPIPCLKFKHIRKERVNVCVWEEEQNRTPENSLKIKALQMQFRRLQLMPYL